MSNQNYSEFSERRANKNKGAGGYKYRKGVSGGEHARKDDPVRWPKAPGERTKSRNTVGWPIVKSSVVNDGIDQ